MEIWSHDGLIDQLGNPYAASGLGWVAKSAREVWGCGLDRLGVDGTKKAPIHVLVDSTKSRIQSDRIISHVWSGRIPAGSLYLLAPGVLIASPAFCCLQIASRASFPRTASVVMECLGLYGKAPVKRGFLDRGALLTPEELTSYLDEAGGLMGAKKVRRALRHAPYPTRSPLETKTVLLLTLPVKNGGYGLCRPEVNYVVRPKADEFSISQYAQYEVDICWPDRRTILEVDSYQYHAKAEQLDTDAKRRNSLKAMGWKVSTVTAGQLSGDALDVLARQVARDLGVRGLAPDPLLRDWLVSELS